MRQTDKSLHSEKFKQVVGGLGKPRGKNPAREQIRSPRDSDRSFPESGYCGGAAGGVLSTAEGPRPSQPRNPPTNGLPTERYTGTDVPAPIECDDIV